MPPTRRAETWRGRVAYIARPTIHTQLPTSMQTNTDSATVGRISGDTLLRWMGYATILGLAAGLVIGIRVLSS